ncbi:MAG: ribonuclease P protein component [Patescibacteria group bacterium]
MLSKEKRLNIKTFKELFDLGKLYHFEYFSIKILKKDDKKLSCFAFIASKKYFKQAVMRNKLRRMGYNSISLIYKDIIPSYFIAFFFKKGVEKVDFLKLKKEIYFSLKKINLIK